MKTPRILSALLAIFFICQCSLGMAPINLALNKPSTMSSDEHWNYYPFLANDGDGATLSEVDMPPLFTITPFYWFVDLEEQVDVTFIVLKSVDGWNNLYVGVGNSTPTNISVPGQDFGVCEHFTDFPGDGIQTIPCDLPGRYVIIFSFNYLNIIEVEVYNTTEPDSLGTNLAINKSSNHNSTNINSGLASLANDGDEYTAAYIYPEKSTIYRPAYWFVDLEEQVDVTFILLKLAEAWVNLYVGVGNSPPTITSVPGQDFGVCKNFAEFPGDWIQTIPCDLSGRYVIIFGDSDVNVNHLEIIEVEVYNTTEPGNLGIGRLNLARGKPSVLSSNMSCCPASQGNNGNASDWAITDNNTPSPHYWYVDLAGRFQVTSIIINNPWNTINVFVGVGDNPVTNTSVPGEDFGVCLMFDRNPNHWIQNIPCSLSGRYVIIFSNEAFGIFEVEVYGIPEPEPVRKREATFGLYQNRRNVMRNVNIIRHLEASSKTECAMWCLNTNACIGFTYYGTSCRLHSALAQDYTGQLEQFVAKSGAVYMQVKDEL